MDYLKMGDRAPAFTALGMNGETIRLEDYRGKRLLLCFFRYATCPFCTVRFVRLAQEVARYNENGLEVLGVFESSADYINKYIGRRGLPFPVIPDPEGRLYQLYGVQTSVPGLMLGMFRIPTLLRALFDPAYKMASSGGKVTRIPADFVLGPDLRIALSYYGKDIGDHVSMKVLDRVASIPCHNLNREEVSLVK